MLTLEQMIGDFADLEARTKARLQGVANASKAVVDSVVESVAAEMIGNTIAAELSQAFSEVLETQEAVNGPRNGEGSDPDDWESQVDDAVCEALKDGYEAVLGAGYCGGVSVDTRLHEPNRPEELAREIATQFAAGIVKRDRDAILRFVSIDMSAPSAAADANELGAARSVVLIVVATYMQKQGAALDMLDLDDMLDLASDTDDGLALGAMQRLAPDFVNTSDIRAKLKLVRASGGPTWRDDVMREASVMADAPLPEAVKPAKKTRKPKAQKEEPAMPANPPEMTDDDAAFLAEMEGAVAPAVLAGDVKPASYVQGPDSAAPGDFSKEVSSDDAREIVTILKATLPMSEKDLAEALGFSRATLNNIVAGKSKLSLTDDQRSTITRLASETVEALDRAVGIMDGRF